MSRYPLPLTRIVHDNLSVLMTFCFSRGPLERLIEKMFVDEWKRLKNGLFEVSEERAKKACFELALFLRTLDDEEQLSNVPRETWSTPHFGVLRQEGESDKPLKLGDVANKIIRAPELSWDFSPEERPLLICRSRKQDEWTSAQIDIVGLADFCSRLMH